MDLKTQILYLFFIAVPSACVAWTITHEEVFREPREFCLKRSKEGNSLITRKFFYLFTCEYCFSHYVTILFLFITNFQFLYEGWRGYLIAGFALVWIANLYMSIYAFLKIDIKKERLIARNEEKIVNGVEDTLPHDRA